MIIGKDYNIDTLNILQNNRDKMFLVSTENINLYKIKTDLNLNTINDIISYAIDNHYINIITLGKINLDNDVINHLFNEINIHIFSLDGLTKNIDVINEIQFKNILNYKKYIFLSSFDTDDYSVSGLIRYFIKLHDDYEISKRFLKNGLKIITHKNFKKKSEIKSESLYTDYIINYIYCQKNSIILCFHLYNIESVLYNNLNGNKIICWQDDLHEFAYSCKDRIEKNISVQQYIIKYEPPYLKELDLLITPSFVYLKNLNIIEYNCKIKSLFYFLNKKHYDQLDYNNYTSRINKIILSGTLNYGYKGRMDFFNLTNNNMIFKDLIFCLNHPGYNKEQNKNHTELSYYNKLAEFKGAFVSHYIFPLNFLLAKHIEVLMCGCLGFFQKNILLKEELGLIEFEHYIPCSDDEGNIIDDEQYYIYWLENGKDIAKTGSEYVRNKFGENYINEYMNLLNNA